MSNPLTPGRLGNSPQRQTSSTPLPTPSPEATRATRSRRVSKRPDQADQNHQQPGGSNPAVVAPPTKRRKIGSSTAQPSTAPRVTAPATPLTAVTPPAPLPSQSSVAPIQFGPLLPPWYGLSDKAIYKLSDEQVWSFPDDIIISASRSQWTSYVYDQCVISIERSERDGQKVLDYVFRCKIDGCFTSKRARGKTGEGTKNIKEKVDTCMASQSVPVEDEEEERPISTYSEPRHRTLLALQCAHSKRPYEMVNDHFYHLQVKMWNRTAIPPSPQTIARDMQRLYLGFAPRIVKYFRDRNRELHVVIDGWTAPIAAALLGVVLVWEDEGKLHRAILEFVELTKSHTGAYLAKELFECLKRYELTKFLRFLAMDNAGNCNTTSTELMKLIPTYLGPLSRIRCFLHIIQLVARIIISFFFKQYKRKKSVKVSDEEGNTSTSIVQSTSADGEEPANDEEAEIAALLEEDELEAELEAAKNGGASAADAQEAHDKKVATTVRDHAIAHMRSKGVSIPDNEQKVALQIFPRVAGLAKKVHDSHVVGEAFRIQVAKSGADGEIDSDITQLSRRVPTRWNSEFDCLDSHLVLKHPVSELMKIRELSASLRAYKLTDTQNDLAEQLRLVLSIIKEPTVLFSQAESPLIIDVVPAMEEMLEMLRNARDDTTLPAVLRVACQAGVMVAEKYYQMIDTCEAYTFAIVLCPQYKLQWFRDRGRSEEDITKIRTAIISRFDESFRRQASSTSTPVSSTASRPVSTARARWGSRSTAEPTPVTSSDDIRVYLDSPVHPLPPATSVIQFWTNRLPHDPSLSKMGLSYCSAPATAVDAERAFSEGRNQCAWNQHNMSVQTFREKMAVGSWADAPWFDLESAVGYVETFAAALRPTAPT